MTTDIAGVAKYDRKRRAYLDEFKSEHCPGRSSGEQFYAALATGILESATEYAKSVGMDAGRGDEGDIGYSEFDELLMGSIEVVARILNALNGWQYEGAELRPWRHDAFALQAAINGKGPQMGRQEIEGAVASYLALPFRRERMDRLLVDLLMALELYAFGNESRAEIKRHGLWGWLRHRIYSAIFWAIIIGLNWKASDWNWWSRDTASTVQLVCLILFGLESAFSFTALFRPSAKGKLLGEMGQTYLELNSDGPISAARVEKRVKAAAAAGVVWPAPLYVLLEDIRGRSGRF